MKRVLVIHGWGNVRPVGHWHRNLVTALRQQGHAVAYPQLPNTEFPNLADWSDVALNELAMLKEVSDDELIVIGHSLGTLTWLHLALSGKLPERPSRVLLVAPADPDLCGEVPSFQLDLTDSSVRAAAHASADATLFVGSDADPWTPRGVAATFAEPLELPLVTVIGAGHFAGEEGWGPWQGILDWVLDPTADLTKR